jgi:hypothetical protein
MELFVPAYLARCIVAVSPDIVLHLFVSRNLVSSSVMEELIFLSQDEPVRIDERSVHPFECSMQIALAVSLTVDQADVWKG